MSGKPLPQVGEVWTCGYVTYECMAGPDVDGLYCWRNTDSGRFMTCSRAVMTPPKPTPPAEAADMWCNHYRDHGWSGPFASASFADLNAASDRDGRMSLAGKWVPCDGKLVLA